MSPRPDTALRPLPGIAAEILESLHQHRLLTARQTHALHTPTTSLRWTQRVLALLAEHGLADRAVGPHGQALWFITRHGSDTLHAAGTHTEPRRHLTSAAQATGPLRAHTLAVNDTGIAFLNVAREREHDDCGPHSWRHEIAHTTSPRRGRRPAQMLIADALLSYLQATPGESLTLHQRFIELDRGTLPVDRLAAKLTLYAQLHHHTPASRRAPRATLARLLPHLPLSTSRPRRPNPGRMPVSHPKGHRAARNRPRTQTLRHRTHLVRDAPRPRRAWPVRADLHIDHPTRTVRRLARKPATNPKVTHAPATPTHPRTPSPRKPQLQ